MSLDGPENKGSEPLPENLTTHPTLVQPEMPRHDDAALSIPDQLREEVNHAPINIAPSVGENIGTTRFSIGQGLAQTFPEPQAPTTFVTSIPLPEPAAEAGERKPEEKPTTVKSAPETRTEAEGKENTPKSVEKKIDRKAEPEPATLEEAKERIKTLQEKIRELEGKVKDAAEKPASPEAPKGKIRRFFEAVGNVFKKTHEFFKEHPTTGVVGGIGTGLVLGSVTMPLVGIFAAPALAAIYLKKAIKEWTGDEWIGKEKGESTTSERKGQPEQKNFLVRGFNELLRNRGYFDIPVARSSDFTQQTIQTLKRGKRIKIPLKDGKIIFGDIDDIEQDSIVLSRYRIQKGKEIDDSSPEKKRVRVKAVDAEKNKEGAKPPASKTQSPEKPLPAPQKPRTSTPTPKKGAEEGTRAKSKGPTK